MKQEYSSTHLSPTIGLSAQPMLNESNVSLFFMGVISPSLPNQWYRYMTKFFLLQFIHFQDLIYSFLKFEPGMSYMKALALRTLVGM
jgi:hypothetical protein